MQANQVTPQFNNRQNIRYTTTCGKELWHSRNVAVCVCVLRPDPSDNTKLQVLAGLRGPDVTDSDLWCMPCGYLDWDESAEQAATREVFEETNLALDIGEIDFINVDSNPEKARQNVTIHFLAWPSNTDGHDLTPKDKGEVKEIRWVTIGEHDKLNWAFDHLTRIDKIIQN